MYADAPVAIDGDLEAGTVTGDGNDELVGLETIVGSEFDDVLLGDDEANTLAGGPGSDHLQGRGGDDRLRSGWGGDDVLDGGPGTEAANYYLGWFPVVADLGTGEVAASGTDTFLGIENLVGSKFDDTLTGDAGDNLIHGSRGNDIIHGAGGHDVVAFFASFEVVIDLAVGTAIEERGSDTLANFEEVIGSTFDDVIVGDSGRNTIWGGRGDDSLDGAGNDDVLVGEQGRDELDGGDGTDACDGENEVACETDPDPALTAGAASTQNHNGGDPYDRGRTTL